MCFSLSSWLGRHFSCHDYTLIDNRSDDSEHSIRRAFTSVIASSLIAASLVLLVVVLMMSPSVGLPSGTVLYGESEPSVSSPPTNFSHLLFWSTDYHITPIADVKFLFSHFGIRVIDKSLSGHCSLMNTCATNLKVLNRDNAYHIGNNPNILSRKLFEAYKDDEEFKRVDAIICFHPIATCRLYAPFNKSLIMISSTRYEHGVFESEAWRSFNTFLVSASRSPRHFVGGNSVYDADYLRYFTGITNVETVPSFTGHIEARYALGASIRRPEILLGHSHIPGFDSKLVWEEFRIELQMAAVRKNTTEARALSFIGISELYGHYKYQQLANHRCIVHMPYQVSVMSFFEQYRMNLPLFYPSLSFLLKLHRKSNVLKERTWTFLRTNRRPLKSDIESAPDIWWPDPNNDVDEHALIFWLSKSDFYVKPHIILYDSYDDLIDKLLSTDYDACSRSMQLENERTESKLKKQWENILTKMFQHRPEGGYIMPSSFESGLQYEFDTAM